MCLFGLAMDEDRHTDAQTDAQTDARPSYESVPVRKVDRDLVIPKMCDFIPSWYHTFPSTCRCAG